jgi:hypothetical protein
MPVQVEFAPNGSISLKSEIARALRLWMLGISVLLLGLVFLFRNVKFPYAERVAVVLIIGALALGAGAFLMKTTRWLIDSDHLFIETSTLLRSSVVEWKSPDIKSVMVILSSSEEGAGTGTYGVIVKNRDGKTVTTPGNLGEEKVVKVANSIRRLLVRE